MKEDGGTNCIAIKSIEEDKEEEKKPEGASGHWQGDQKRRVEREGYDVRREEV